MDYKEAIETLRGQHRINVVRGASGFSFGTKEECTVLFQEAFKAVDLSVRDYKHLPEYDQVIDWMTDTKDKGLWMMGDCGRGKSVILTGVLPILMLAKRNKVLTTYPAEHIPILENTILKKWAIALDDIGTETQVNDYGEKHEGFNAIMNEAERRMAPVFGTTNLNPNELLERYGERTMERIYRLCRIIKFEGPSLRQ